jgi:hypothetical protein
MKRARKSRSGGRPRDKQKTDYAGMYWPVKVLASSDGLRCSMTTAKWRLSARQRAPFCRPVRRGAYSAVEARTVFSIRQSRCSPGRFWCASFEWLGNPSVCRRGRLQRPYPSSTAGAPVDRVEISVSLRRPCRHLVRVFSFPAVSLTSRGISPGR